MADQINKSQSRLATNPFVVETPEKLTAQQIVDLFIEKFTPIETIKQRKHTFIWGSRGSGKSMMCRYLEPRCQQVKVGELKDFLATDNAFVAIYCPCKEGQVNKSELQLIESSSAAILSEHTLNLIITERLVACLESQFPQDFFDLESLIEFAKRVVKLFDRASVATSLEIADQTHDVTNSPLRWLRTIIDAETVKVARFLQRTAIRPDSATYEGATSGYNDFLLPLMRYAKLLPGLANCTIFIILDDADRLTKQQQSIINEWIANRDHSTLCFKVSARQDHYKTMMTRSGSSLEQPHDYSQVNVDDFYTSSKTDYWEKVRLIADRRLELANLLTTSVEAFLPADEAESRLYSAIRRKTEEQWEQLATKPGLKSDYVLRMSIPRLFQHLAKVKKRKSYAGFDTLVDLSSGIVRDFLEPCYLMFDVLLGKGQSAENITSIPSRVQDEVIYQYSEEFLLEKFESLRQEVPPEEWGLLDKLRCLIESLGRLFYTRLHDPSAAESRVFSITVNGAVSSDVREVFRLGEKHRYLQHRTYSSKQGGGREDWYILNRRLCPIYKLDPSGFEGRIQIAAELLTVACEDPDRFVRLRLRKVPQSQTPSLFNEEDSEGDATS